MSCSVEQTRASTSLHCMLPCVNPSPSRRADTPTSRIEDQWDSLTRAQIHVSGQQQQ